MRCLVPIKQGKRLVAGLIFCSVLFFGCQPSENPRLYIYCNETFWYVMQEESRLFHKIYGCDVTLIPLRSERTTRDSSGTVEIDADHHAPAPWRSMPKDPATLPSGNSSSQDNADIDQQIERIASESFGDLFLSDSPTHAVKLQKLALTIKELPICYLTLTMLVPKENPHRFQSIKDVLESKRTLGIVDPSLDGLGESSWNLLGKIVPGGESAIPRTQIQFYERQYDLLEALENGAVDAVLVWDATSLTNFLLIKYGDSYNEEYADLLNEAERKKDDKSLLIILQSMYEHLMETKSFTQAVPLSNHPEERRVVAAHLLTLGTASRYAYCERFADFIRSPQGKNVFQRFGFVTQ